MRLVNRSITPDWHLLHENGESHQLDVGGQLIADNPELLLDVVQQDMGIALLPMFSVLDAVRAGKLCRILPQWRSPDIGVYTLLPSRHFIDAKTRVWLDWVEKHISPRIERDAGFFINS